MKAYRAAVMDKSQGELPVISSLPLAWQTLRPETQQALADLKTNQVSASTTLQANAFLLLAEDYECQGQYHYATGLYNYLLTLANKQALPLADNNTQPLLTSPQLQAKLQAMEEGFMQSLGLNPGANPYAYTQSNAQHRADLEAIRTWCQEELNKIDSQYSFDIYDEEKMQGRETEVQHLQLQKAEAIYALYHRITERIKVFIRCLVVECLAILGQPPCEYAIIGLGSLAREETTPYSDFEFAILIAEEKEDYKRYFRDLTKLLHLKVINLGETILPAMAIPALNDYYSQDSSDNWFYDDLTPRGFAFDGNMPQACKTPLGKKDAQGNSIYELIQTPQLLAHYQIEDWFKREHHLPLILLSASLIQGNEALMHAYETEVWQTLTKLPEGYKARAITLLKEDIQLFQPKLYDQSEEGKLFIVKQEIYRLLSIFMDRLSLFYGLQDKKSTKQRIDALFQGNGKSNLTIAASISLELRLRTYLANKGQKEKLNATYYSQPEELHKIFTVTSPSILFTFYYIVLDFANTIREFVKADIKSANNLLAMPFFNNNEKIKGQIYKRLLNYPKAKEQFLLWLDKAPADIEALDFLISLMIDRGDYQELQTKIGHYEKLVQADSYQANLLLQAIAYNNIGNYYRSFHQYDKAIKYYQASLAIKENHFSEDKLEQANPYYSLGLIYIDQGHYTEGLSYLQKSLALYKAVPQSKADQLNCYLNIGVAYLQLTDYQQAKMCMEQCLTIAQNIYGVLHPDIARLLTDLGNVYYRLGNYQKALSSHIQALNAAQFFFLAPNPILASIRDNLASTYLITGNYEMAKAYAEDSLKQRLKIYSAVDKEVVQSYVKLCAIYRLMGMLESAKRDAEIALQCIEQLGVNAFTTDDLSDYYFEIGKLYSVLDNEHHARAIKYHRKALRCLAHYHQLNNTLHPKTIIIHNALGNCYLPDAVAQAEYEFSTVLTLGNQINSPTSQLEVASAYSSLGRIQFNGKKYSEAIKHYLNAITQLQNLLGRHQDQDGILQNLARCQFNIGNAYFFNGELEKAIYAHQACLATKLMLYGNELHTDLIGSYRCLSELYERCAERVESTVYLVKALRIEGNQLFNEGDFEQAIQKYLEILLHKVNVERDGLVLPTTLAPLLGSICHNLGCAYHCQAINTLQHQLIEDAERAFQAALIFYPHSGIFCEFGLFRYQQHAFSEAIPLLEQSIVQANDGKQLIYTRLERPTLLPELQTILDDQGEITIKASLLAYRLLVSANQQLAQYQAAEKALEALAKAVKAERDPIVYLLLGDAYRELKQYHEAIQSYQWAIQCYQPTDEQTKYPLAQERIAECEETLELEAAIALSKQQEPIPSISLAKLMIQHSTIFDKEVHDNKSLVLDEVPPLEDIQQIQPDSHHENAELKGGQQLS